MENKYNLRPLWDAILDIYKAIADICERHKLRFYVTGGNCLGAVRHKGFIPWDDDMDVFLPWDDYDKFWKYAKDELPEYWKDVGWWNTPEYGEMFGKIQETRREVVERVANECGQTLAQGIYVDVFPLVNCPYTFSEKIRWAIAGFFLRLKVSLVFNKGHRPTLSSKLAGLFGWMFWWVYPSIKDTQSVMRIQERRARKIRRYIDGYCGWYVPSLYNVIAPIPTKYFEKMVYLAYDAIKVPVPEDYDGYLRYKFGDYMKLPPEEERIPKHGDIVNAPWRLGPTGADVRNR